MRRAIVFLALLGCGGSDAAPPTSQLDGAQLDAAGGAQLDAAADAAGGAQLDAAGDAFITQRDSSRDLELYDAKRHDAPASQLNDAAVSQLDAAIDVARVPGVLACGAVTCSAQQTCCTYAAGAGCGPCGADAIAIVQCREARDCTVGLGLPTWICCERGAEAGRPYRATCAPSCAGGAVLP